MVLPVNFKTLFPAVLLLACSVSSFAQAESTITEDAVQKFYEKSALSMKKATGGWDKVATDWDALLHKDFTSTFRMVFNVPGHGEMKQTMQYTKASYLNQLKNNKMHATSYANMDVTIEEISVASDGKTAKVSNKNHVVTRNKEPGPKGRLLEMNTKSVCSDVVALSAGGSVQLLSSDCDSVVETKEDL